MTEHGYVQFPEKGLMSDLPQEIKDDIKASFKAYFHPDTVLGEDDWDMTRHCKVVFDKANGNYIFLKLVSHGGQIKVGVFSLPRKLTDQWMKNEE